MLHALISLRRVVLAGAALISFGRGGSVGLR